MLILSVAAPLHQVSTRCLPSSSCCCYGASWSPAGVDLSWGDLCVFVCNKLAAQPLTQYALGRTNEGESDWLFRTAAACWTLSLWVGWSLVVGLKEDYAEFVWVGSFCWASADRRSDFQGLSRRLDSRWEAVWCITNRPQKAAGHHTKKRPVCEVAPE